METVTGSDVSLNGIKLVSSSIETSLCLRTTK